MADNFAFTEGTGKTGAADEIGGVLYPRVKVTWGADGIANDTDTASGKALPVQLRDSSGTEVVPLTTSDFDTKVGSLTETAPATDTASSGLNGRLQRIAQRLTSLIALLPTLVSGRWPVDGSGVTQPVSAASLPLPTGAATAAKQPALGIAGTASSDVITVQGIASMTAIKTDGSATTQPVSGTITANIGTSGSLALDATLTGGTQKTKIVDSGGTNVATVSAAGAVKVDGSAVTQPVSISGNQAVNVAQINGVTPLMGNGTTGTGSQRVTIASDNTAFAVNSASATAPVSSMNSSSASSGLNSAMAAVFDDVSPTSITENNFGFVRMSANRNQYATIRDAAGNERGVNVNSSNQLSVSVDNSNVSANVAQFGGTNVVNGGTAGVQSVGGPNATNVAIGSNPVNIGAQGVSSENSAVTTGRMVQLVADLVGKQIVLPYANPENFVNGTTSAITDTTSTSTIGAQGAGVRTYITSIIVTNSHATVGTFVKILDGASIIWEGYAAAAGGGFTQSFPVPLRGTANTAVNTQCVTTGANVIASIAGYKGA